MSAREKMIAYRESISGRYEDLARKMDIPPILLEWVENGQVTHPKIVKRMQDYYGLTDEEAEELMPVNLRKSHPKYDPEMYMSPVDILLEKMEKMTGRGAEDDC